MIDIYHLQIQLFLLYFEVIIFIDTTYFGKL